MGEVVPSNDREAVGEPAPVLELRRFGYRVRERADVVALVMITAVAAGVRFATLGDQGLDHDEAVTAFGVLQPTLGGTLSAVGHLERTPPLYYVLAWLWTKPLGFGAGVVDLRALSAIFGTLTVPVVYLAARELVSRRAGVFTAALVALNPFLVWYSQEARSYALVVLLIALGLYLFARVLRDPSRRNLGLWAGASVLALCTHYFAAFMVVPEAIWLIVAIRPRRRVIAAMSAITVAGLALLPLAITQEGSGNTDWFSATSVLTRVWQIPVHYAAGVKPEILSPHGWLAAVQISAAAIEIALLAAGVAILVHRGRRRERQGALLASGLAAAAFVVPVAMAAVGLDYMDARNLIGTLVPLLVAAGIAFSVTRARVAGTVAAAAACAFFAAVLVMGNLTPQMQRPDWRTDAAAIAMSPAKRIVVVPRSAGPPLSYYLDARQTDGDGHPEWTREIDLLSREPTTDGPRTPFSLASEHRVRGGMWITRYRSERPVLVWLSADRAHRMIGQGASALVTLPPASGALHQPAW